MILNRTRCFFTDFCTLKINQNHDAANQKAYQIFKDNCNLVSKK